MAGEKLQILSVINFKGGSAKTTLLPPSQYLALRGYRVLAIDLDPQASLSTLFGQQPELDVLPNETLYGALRYDSERTSIEEIIPQRIFQACILFRATWNSWSSRQRPRLRRKKVVFLRIFQALQPVESEYDVVVMDCPPNLGYLTMAALSAATSLLVTVHPQMLDVLSMAQFLKMVGDTVNLFGDRRPDYDWLRYLITRYEPNDGPQNQMVTWMRSLFEHRVLQNPVLKSTAIAD